MYTTFRESYYNKKKRNPILSPSAFKSIAPIVVVNTSKQNDESITSAVNISIKIEALESLFGISAYCILIHDSIIEYVTLTRDVRDTCMNLF